jgi:signal peptidase I
MKPWMRWTLWLVLVGGVIFGVLRYWFIDFHLIADVPTDPLNWANSPNLEPGDYVLVWRGGKPHIGDMVRCPDPAPPDGQPRWLIARVAGVAGDKIEIAEGQLRINGFRVPTGACQGTPRKVLDESGSEQDMVCYAEELGGGKHDVQVLATTAMDMPETTVAADKLYLLSDNRSSPWSRDSRNPDIGQVDASTCTQRLVVRIVSKNGWKDEARRMGFLF